jgi:hypothetical protein
MYIATVPNRGSPPAILLRESYREDGKVKSRTLANLSDWPAEKVEALRAVLKGDVQAGVAGPFEIARSLPHGHVTAVLGTIENIGLDTILGSRHTRERDILVALIASRVLQPRSKLSFARSLTSALQKNSLSTVLDLLDATVQEVYAAMDLLLSRQDRIEAKLAAKHLSGGCLVLYDVSSTWFEGKTCPLARRGYSRDGRPSSLQIVFGVLTNSEGCPVAVEVFEGNTGDPSTVASQVEKLARRFSIEHVILVGDRGMLTHARIQEDLAPNGLRWVTAIRHPTIRSLARKKVLQPSLFDQTDLAELTSPDYPGERLIVCRNPLRARAQAARREELLADTEFELRYLQRLAERGELRGVAAISERVGLVMARRRMRRHLVLRVGENQLEFSRNEETLREEAGLDGIYVVRTNVEPEVLDSASAVRVYKSLAKVERVFRSMKTTHLEVRPIHHHLPDRVRAHLLLCMLSYYVLWHMESKLAPLLFVDEDPEAGEAERASVVTPARRSPSALEKAAKKVNASGLPLQSLRDLFDDLATLARHTVRPAGDEAGPTTVMYTRPTAWQRVVFERLGVRPEAW